MSVKDTKKKSKTDWDRLRVMGDRDIDLSDIPELSPGFFKNAALRLPKPKRAVSIRLDPEVLDWFKRQGRGYQTRINAILRMYMEAQSRH